jgi:hypothetical protein
VEVARSSGMVSEDVFSTVIAASLLSILLNVFVVRAAFKWADQGLPVKGRLSVETP